MQTVHLSNFEFDLHQRSVRLTIIAYATVCLIIIMTAATFALALLYTALLSGLATLLYWIIRKSQVRYTLTATHFQQHNFRGGWVVKWNNIREISQCTYDIDGWHQPLPWIGIRLKSYTPYLDSICPRIISEILLSQRGLLYLGMKQHNAQMSEFEDIVLDPSLFKSEGGKVYSGLLAMLANRMRYQRNYHGYDLFISMSDLGIHGDELIGMARRYIAAAEPDHPPQ
ncbi:DUF2982 domain-containing protein [Vibrio mangrovi]|nr:DUF2982 domain-containing protein [Vibrio mangrovi]SMR99333.1 hypothetical protein VIM7927_00558 [Vibrio mangrovi]